MPSTYDPELVGSILGQIEDAIDTIRVRTRSISVVPRPSVDLFPTNPLAHPRMTADSRENVTVYTPGSALRQPSRLIADMFRDIWRHRGPAWRLAVRDISAQYRQAASKVVSRSLRSHESVAFRQFRGLSGAASGS